MKEDEDEDEEQGMMKMDRKKIMNIENDFNIIEQSIIKVIRRNLDLIPYIYIVVPEFLLSTKVKVSPKSSYHPKSHKHKVRYLFVKRINKYIFFSTDHRGFEFSNKHIASI